MISKAISVSARGLADFKTSEPSAQRRIVRTNRYPSSRESKAIVAYYRDARTTAARFFERGRLDHVLEDAIRAASEKVDGASPSRRARLGQNIRAIQDFQKSDLKGMLFHVEPRPRIELDMGSLTLKIHPSLCLCDQAGNTHWMFLDFSESEMEGRKTEIVLQLFLQGARAEAINLKPRCAEYHHLHSGRQQVARRHRARLEAQIAASCQTFRDIWASM
jgi:hypothetical protein